MLTSSMQRYEKRAALLDPEAVQVAGMFAAATGKYDSSETLARSAMGNIASRNSGHPQKSYSQAAFSVLSNMAWRSGSRSVNGKLVRSTLPA